jgi:hypothetical protein
MSPAVIGAMAKFAGGEKSMPSEEEEPEMLQ